MRKLAAAFALVAFGFAGSAHAAAVSNSLKQAAQKSFQGLQNGLGKNNYLKGDRLSISSNGKTARVAIQTFGVRPGPVIFNRTQPKRWYDIKTATFTKAKDGTWSKQGRWNTLMFALAAAQ